MPSPTYPFSSPRKGDGTVMVTEILVDAGSCKFKTRITVGKLDGKLRVETVSSCEKVRLWAEKLGSEVEALSLTKPFCSNPAYLAADEPARLCPPCPVPTAFLMAAWAEAGYLIKRNPSIGFREAGRP
ncbi:MAG: hypothetical protein DRO46_01520 [Candidatus Hecatellales archaeon]|nr:MAG: hypothetical protein DRO46_01520 [Candidatus Hecatellales archaeon]